MAKNLLMDKVVTRFEKKISEFYGSKYAVATDSCTHAIELSLIYKGVKKITIPTRTYISIPFLAKKLNLQLEWSTKKWSNYYFIENTNIIDAAVYWKEKSYMSIISLYDDQKRAMDFSVDLGNLFFDYSKTQIDDECRAELLKLVELKRVEKFRRSIARCR